MGIKAEATHGRAKMILVRETAQTLGKTMPLNVLQNEIEMRFGVKVTQSAIWHWLQRPKLRPIETGNGIAEALPYLPDIETEDIEIQTAMKECFAYTFRSMLWNEAYANAATNGEDRADAIMRGVACAKTVGDLFSKMIERMDDSAKLEALDKMQAVLGELRVRKNAVAS